MIAKRLVSLGLLRIGLMLVVGCAVEYGVATVAIGADSVGGAYSC